MILIEEGQSPLILCLPHSGTDVPEAVSKRLNATGRLQADLAWRLERVFGIRSDLDATMLSSTVSRYVIDLDKDPEKGSRPGEIGHLCPVTTLDGKRIYQEREEPGPAEIEQRRLLFFEPFQRALKSQISRLLKQHRNVFVLNCQSMRSQIRGVTSSALPLVNIGSAQGASCAPDLKELFVRHLAGQEEFTVSINEHAKGGFITRSCGRPDAGVHALTLLLAQRSYLRHESPPFEPDKIRVARLQATMRDCLSRVIDWTTMKQPVNMRNAVPDPVAELSPVSIKVSADTLPKVRRAPTGNVEEDDVIPLLVAE